MTTQRDDFTDRLGLLVNARAEVAWDTPVIGAEAAWQKYLDRKAELFPTHPYEVLHDSDCPPNTGYLLNPEYITPLGYFPLKGDEEPVDE